jgi:hypothetical protein
VTRATIKLALADLTEVEPLSLRGCLLSAILAEAMTSSFRVPVAKYSYTTNPPGDLKFEWTHVADAMQLVFETHGSGDQKIVLVKVLQGSRCRVCGLAFGACPELTTTSMTRRISTLLL